MKHSLEPVAAQIALEKSQPVYIVREPNGKETLTLAIPGSIEWKKRKFEWIKTIKPGTT